MTTDTDIHFGDLEESAPEKRLRPDRNKHYAVVGYEKPSERDLPVFIDVDVVRDIEDHAASDTSVELGGVLLGGQYVDEQGQPFVLITDSLRAEHYESTKGSFKFTHDTWSAITRERDEFPQELQMVGWYHTHPDWGVFLSGMDMFICDNFFNKRLDVAYVVDPCRGDRGMFQWTGDPENRVRRTEGFYLTGSRFRKRELLEYAAWLKGGDNMAHDPRSAGAGPYPAPVVHIAEQRSGWLGVAVTGMLMTQFLLLLLIAWRIAGPAAASGPAASENGGSARVAELEQSLAALREARQLRAEADAQTRAVDRVVSQLQGVPQGAVESLVEQEKLNEELRAAIVGHGALRQEMQAAIEEKESDLKRAASAAQQDQAALQSEIDKLQLSYDRLAVRTEEKDVRIAALQQRLERYEPSEKEADAEQPAGLTIGGVTLSWWAVASGAIVIVVVAVGVFGWMTMRPAAEELPENDDAQFASSFEDQ